MSDPTTGTTGGATPTEPTSNTTPSEPTNNTTPPQPTSNATPTEPARTDSILVGAGTAAAMATPAPARHRPFMVTVLAIVTGILAVLSAFHLLQALGIIPYVVGRFEVRSFSLLYAIMWGLMIWVWVWVTQMLWKVDPQAWIFLLVISMFNLFFDFILLIGDTSWQDVSASFLINGLVLLYCLLPSTKRAFEMT